MSNKSLQRVTECVSDIGQEHSRRLLRTRRNHITQKVKIAGSRTLYLSVHDAPQPAEIFLRLIGADCTSELIALYDVIARLMSIALQFGAPREPLVADSQHARLPKGFSKARRALVVLLQLTPREAISEAKLRDYDRLRGALLDIIVEPFMRMLDNDPELSLVAHDHEG